MPTLWRDVFVSNILSGELANSHQSVFERNPQQADFEQTGSARMIAKATLRFDEEGMT